MNSKIILAIHVAPFGGYQKLFFGHIGVKKWFGEKAPVWQGNFLTKSLVYSYFTKKNLISPQCGHMNYENNVQIPVV